MPTFAFGILSLNGVVYCSSPFLTYFVGCCGLCKIFYLNKYLSTIISILQRVHYLNRTLITSLIIPIFTLKNYFLVFWACECSADLVI